MEYVREFVPLQAVVEHILTPYVTVQDHAEHFIQSNSRHPDRSLWVRLYQSLYPRIYADVHLDPERAEEYVFISDPNILTIFIMVDLISEEIIKDLLRQEDITPLNDFNLRVYFQIHPQSYEHFAFRDLVFTRLFTSAVYLVEIDPEQFTDYPTSGLGVLVEVSIYYNEMSQRDQSNFTLLIKRLVDLLSAHLYRPLDMRLSLNDFIEETLFSGLIAYIPTLALFYIDTFPPGERVNYLTVNKWSQTYLHLAAMKRQMEVYTALVTQEPRLSQIRDADGHFAYELSTD